MICSDAGPHDAEIMLIGESPGEEEEQAGKPFVGAAGQMLKQMLSHSGIDFNSCFTTNVMDVRPPGNKFKYFYERKQPSRQLEEAWHRLQNKVESIHPKVVICLGAEPLKALCNKSGISNWRGTWLSFRNINVMPTYHPSYVLRVYKDHPIVECDLQKAVNNKPRDNPSMLVEPTARQVVDYIDGCKGRIAFDIETIGRHIRHIGIANNQQNYRAISIPFIKFSSSDMARPSINSTVVKLSTPGGMPGSYWSPSEEIIVLDAIDKLFRSGIEVVGQNSIAFDAPLIKQEFGLTISNHFIDTMHAWHVLYPEFPKSLSFLCSMLTDYRNYWTDVDHSNDKQEGIYNAMDCVVTLDVSYKIERELRESVA
jgi:uracil-DNA glycosylase family 4